MADVFKLGFIGAGNMAESIARGVAKSGVLPPSFIRTSHRRPDRCDSFRSFGVQILESNSQVVDDSDIIILSVKPQMVKNVLWELKSSFSEEKVLVSVAAGIKLKDLQEWSGHRRVIRVMPNTPSAVGEAASVMCMGEMATEKDAKRISSLFGAIGKIWTADEKYFDAVTGLSGSGPAYVFLAIEALADGGVAAGLPRDLALGLASQTESLNNAVQSRGFRSSFHGYKYRKASWSVERCSHISSWNYHRGDSRVGKGRISWNADERCRSRFKTVQRTFSNVVLSSFVIIWTSFIEGIFSVPPWLEIDNAAFDTS